MAGPNAGVVIIGSGLGGYTLAREFRKIDTVTPLTVITADGGESYSKPMLSTALSQGKDARSLVMKTAEQMAEELSLRVLVRHSVAAIDRTEKTVRARRLAGGDTVLAYDRLVLAIGADPRPYRVEGGEMVRIHAVNNLDDYAAWRQRLSPGARVLLVGAGLIGCEFANDLAGAGFAVTVVDPSPWPLGRLLPEAIGRELAAALEAAGVVLRLGRSVARVSPGRVVLDDGSTFDVDLALSAIGLVPRTQLAGESGLTVDRGIVVDRFLTTSDPAIHALGDCAQTEAGLLPFVLPLMAEAKALAATLTGRPTALALPAMPVVVKTPCLPLAVCPPSPGADGNWVVEGEGRDRKAVFVSPDGTQLGFVLSGAAAAERQALAKAMPDLLPQG